MKPRSTLLLNFATEKDAERFCAMHRRLFVFGCLCEPGVFQPRDRDRICTRCWNPLARHRERDFACRERCRICGGAHCEEDHACTECDVLAKPCAHIKLRCVNCGQEHAADDERCEYRRRARGTIPSAPPMSDRSKSATPKERKKKGKKVHILEPHEPFPDDQPSKTAPPAPPRKQTPRPAPTLQDVQTVVTSTPVGTSPPPAQGGKRQERDRATHGGAEAAETTPTTMETAEQAGEDESATMDDAECAAITDLVGATRMRDDLVAGDGEAQGEKTAAHRSSSTRIAASEAAKEDKRRRVAHVLTRNFKFLNHPGAVSALKARMDDYVSTVSWASDEQNKQNKPGMQGKTDASLRKLVEEMTQLAAEKPTPNTARASTSRNA